MPLFGTALAECNPNKPIGFSRLLRGGSGNVLSGWPASGKLLTTRICPPVANRTGTFLHSARNSYSLVHLKHMWQNIAKPSAPGFERFRVNFTDLLGFLVYKATVAFGWLMPGY